MQKLDVENLSIEITRFCNLECIHCLRGDSERKYIDKNTINNLMNNINSINLLTITGGEPLIAIKQINELINSIRQNNIKVKDIQLITNGTILSSNTLKCLKDLTQISNLHLYISNDKFHQIELEKNDLLERKDKIKKVYKELFNAKDYGDYSNTNRVIIKTTGRGELLNNEDINKINLNYKSNYILSSMVNTKVEFITPYIKENKVLGKLTIDVHGNIVGDNQSFINEDKKASYNTNINNISLEEGINNNLINIIENRELLPILEYYYKDKIKKKGKRYGNKL